VTSVERPDGCRLHTEIHGPAGAPALLLIEGLGGDIGGWRRNIPTLAQELRVIAFDLRGNGRSDAPDAPITMATFVDDAVAVLDAAGAEAAHVYGQSLGGMIAIELALAHPGRVRSLILAATHAGLRTAVRSRHVAPKDRPWELLYSEQHLRERPDEVADDLRSGTEQPPHAARRQWEAMRRFEAADRLADVAVPTLVLHGTDDRMIPVENARALAAGIPGARLVELEGAGHVYHAEQPEASDRAVLDFVRSVAG
jgi:pimeloyl-ACP methyl ester carboxylesterase